MNIMKRAAQIRRKNKKLTVQQSVKKAAAENRAKKKVGSTRRKKSAPRKRTVKTAVVTRVKTVKVGRPNVTVASLGAQAKRMLLEDIGKLEARKYAASTKRDKNKLQKEISAKKAKYRKFA